MGDVILPCSYTFKSIFPLVSNWNETFSIHDFKITKILGKSMEYVMGFLLVDDSHGTFRQPPVIKLEFFANF